MNNGILNAVKAMPMKDITSDGGSSFAMSRLEYVRALPTNTIKKWYGNRDASQITANRRISEVGLGSLNATASPMSYKTTVDNNTARLALNRVRSGGAVKKAKIPHIL